MGAINKIDLFKNAGDQETISRLRKEVVELIGGKEEEIFMISGKTGEGVEEMLNEIIRRVPPPRENNIKNLNRALIFDSFYDDHKGVMASVRVFDGEIDPNENVYLVAPDTVSKIKEVGYFKPQIKAAKSLKAGEIGYIATGIKDTSLIKIGDTAISAAHHPDKIKSFILPGYKEPRPVVFVSFYPEENDDYELLKKSLEKLKLSDSALTIEPDQNEVLGRGYKSRLSRPAPFRDYRRTAEARIQGGYCEHIPVRHLQNKNQGPACAGRGLADDNQAGRTADGV